MNASLSSQSGQRALIATLLERQMTATFAAHGPSMNPTLADGDHVRVRPLRDGDLRPGAIVLFRSHGRLTLHRIVGRVGNDLLATGDAALEGALRIARADCLGIAELRLRNTGETRLDSAGARLRGRLRYALRPLRRLAARLLVAR